MDDFTVSLVKNSSLGKVLEVFDKTKLAFVPITTSYNSSDKSGSTRDSTAEEEEEELDCINFHKGYSTYNSKNEY